MHPDLFITIAFVSLVVALALVGLVVARHERRRNDLVDDVIAKRPAGDDRSS